MEFIPFIFPFTREWMNWGSAGVVIHHLVWGRQVMIEPGINGYYPREMLFAMEFRIHVFYTTIGRKEERI